MTCMVSYVEWYKHNDNGKINNVWLTHFLEFDIHNIIITVNRRVFDGEVKIGWMDVNQSEVDLSDE